MDQVAIEAKDPAEHAVEQPHAAASDGIEDWLDITGRGSDHPEDLGRRCLMVKSLAQRALKVCICR
jgi:hypothetical protein